MSFWRDVFGLDLFTEPGLPPVRRKTMRYQGKTYGIGDEIVVKERRYVIRDITPDCTVVVPREMSERYAIDQSQHIVEDVRRALDEGWS